MNRAQITLQLLGPDREINEENYNNGDKLENIGNTLYTYFYYTPIALQIIISMKIKFIDCLYDSNLFK